jgi:hypothetical protein
MLTMLSALLYSTKVFTQKFNVYRPNADALFGTCDISSETINISVALGIIFGICSGDYTEHVITLCGQNAGL